VTRATAEATPANDRRADRGTPVQRARAGALTLLSWLACRLPEGPQVALAEFAGRAWYRVAPARAEQARANLRRIVAWLAENGSTDPRILAAAKDPAALERLVRSAFRHNARYYLEVIRAPSLTAAVFEERLVIETPDTVAAAFADPRPKVFITGHLGPIEMPGLYLASRSQRRITAPMETVDDPALQGWFERTRAAFGVRIVTLREARRELLAALRSGESVGLVADRDITGGGTEVSFFGAPAPLPIGPALLAVETGAPIYLAGVWRVGRRGYHGRLIEVPVVRDGPRRAQVAGTLAGEARAFEEVIARAPEQWMAIFFPIWAAGADPEPAG
jgi:KDO2-lipid IV(A) lauroyltransferase